MPTERLLRMVESNETNTHFVASAQPGGRADHPIDDRLAVFRFARLEEGRVGAGLDEVALREDPEQPHGLALDLAADDERGVEGSSVLLQMLPVAALDIPHGVRNDTATSNMVRALQIGRPVGLRGPLVASEC